MPVVQVDGHGALRVPEGTLLLDVCQDGGLPMESECGGFAACNSCRVEVLGGASQLSPVVDEEEVFLDHEGQRLACQAEVLGDVQIRLDPGI